MRKELLIRAVHLNEVVHARQENIYFHHLADVRAGGLQHGAQVLDAELRHGGDGGVGEAEDRAAGCAGDLPGAVDHAGGGDGLGVGPCCWRSVSWGLLGGMME